MESLNGTDSKWYKIQFYWIFNSILETNPVQVLFIPFFFLTKQCPVNALKFCRSPLIQIDMILNKTIHPADGGVWRSQGLLLPPFLRECLHNICCFKSWRWDTKQPLTNPSSTKNLRCQHSVDFNLKDYIMLDRICNVLLSVGCEERSACWIS